jgi:ArsR family transcriptional regulator
MDSEAIAETCKALAHPARVRIVELLAEQQECRGADVFAELPLAQSTISQHLGILKDAGLVSSTSMGTSMVYCLNPAPLDDLIESLSAARDATPTCTASPKGGSS